MAPAFWAFLTLTVNPQTPRSTSAILPATAAAFVSGVQPFVVDVSGATPSIERRTTSPVDARSPSAAGPKAAPPAAQVRAIAPGC